MRYVSGSLLAPAYVTASLPLKRCGVICIFYCAFLSPSGVSTTIWCTRAAALLKTVEEAGRATAQGLGVRHPTCVERMWRIDHLLQSILRDARVPPDQWVKPHTTAEAVLTRFQRSLKFAGIFSVQEPKRRRTR